jgi:ferredoxin-NADP reductase
MDVPKPHDFSLPFLKKEQVAQNAFAFYFDRKNSDLEFIAGQYTRVILPHDNADTRGTSRLFSIAVSPLQKELLRIVTKIVPESGSQLQRSSFKNMLFNLEAGKPVSFFGPMGRFTLRQDVSSYVFLVGGIGITPLLSILPFASAQKLPVQITVFLSFSTVEEVLFKDELLALSQQNPGIKIIYTVSHPEGSSQKWEGEQGRISTELIKKYVPDVTAPHYYVVGPQTMVLAMAELAKSLGVTEEKIIKEQFIGY